MHHFDTWELVVGPVLQPGKKHIYMYDRHADAFYQDIIIMYYSGITLGVVRLCRPPISHHDHMPPPLCQLFVRRVPTKRLRVHQLTR